MTRDAIQGYIDGYNKGGGQDLQADLVDWLATHPVYPQNKSMQAVVIADLESYRGVVQASRAPDEVTPTP